MMRPTGLLALAAGLLASPLFAGEPGSTEALGCCEPLKAPSASSCPT
ncbi:MAG: hypothetical protein QM703_11910 [Gemmatales bacterium]